jgi:AcrR family transcriptional regulator
MPRSKAYDVDEVLDRAMHVFWENGYKATSVRQLEKAMKINQFSIYASFSDKRQLFIKSLRKYRTYARNSTFQILLKENAGMEELKQFFSVLAENAGKEDAKKGCLIVNTASEIGAKDKLVRKEVQEYFYFIVEMFHRILLRAQERSEISPEADIDKYSNYLLGIMQSLSLGMKVMDKKQIGDFIGMALVPIK